MTHEQIAAYTAPCFHAEQCIDIRYRHFRERESKLFSVILTANIGLE